MSDRSTDAWGRVVINPEAAFKLAYEGHDIWSVPVGEGEVIHHFNEVCHRFDKTEFLIEGLPEPTNSAADEHAARAATWLISDDIRNIDVRTFLLGLCKTDEQRARVNEEMDLFEERKLQPLLQLMMYLVDHFRRNGIVWGVGRGSSVASYCLYLIGVHKIDSLRYGLSIREFLKEKPGE